MAEEYAVFRPNTADKLVRLAENGLTNQATNSQPSRRHFTRLAMAKAPAGGIAASSSTTPGSGTITFWRINDSGYYESTGATETAYNLSRAGAVAASAMIVVGLEIFSQRWIVIWEDCPA